MGVIEWLWWGKREKGGRVTVRMWHPDRNSPTRGDGGGCGKREDGGRVTVPWE